LSRRDLARPAVLDAGALLRGLERSVRRLVPSRIELVTEIADEALPVWFDETHLQQVVMNLVLNARDAIPGDGRISLSARVRAAAAGEAPPGAARRTVGQPVAGPAVALAVADTGAGMDGETLRRVGEPFFTTKERGKGTGLGLSTVATVVEGARGQVEIVSSPGGGTVVTLLLPLADRAGLATPEVPGASPAPGGALRVLLAEDNDAVRAVLVRALRAAGHEVKEAHDATAAVRCLEEALGGPGTTVLKKPFPPEDLLRAIRGERSDGPGSQA
jgi:hypothetical protein